MQLEIYFVICALVASSLGDYGRQFYGGYNQNAVSSVKPRDNNYRPSMSQPSINSLISTYQSNYQQCRNGETTKINCNNCYCDRGGWRCTKMLCPAEKPKICTPGSSFMRDCNSCFCTEDGTNASCTRMACPKERPGDRIPYPVDNTNELDDKLNEGQYCTPGQMFKKDCNTCVCSPDGKNAACTLKMCPEGF